MGMKQSSSGGHGNTNTESIPNTTSSFLQVISSSAALHCKKLLEEELERLFRRYHIDTDVRRKIKIEELQAILSTLCDTPVSDSELRALLSYDHGDSADEEDGCIPLEEVVMLITKNVDDHVIMKDLGKAFSVFDVDGDGFICAEELHEVLGRRLGKDASMEQCRNIVREFDRNDDGVICFEEFVTMMLSSSSPNLMLTESPSIPE